MVFRSAFHRSYPRRFSNLEWKPKQPEYEVDNLYPREYREASEKAHWLCLQSNPIWPSMSPFQSPPNKLLMAFAMEGGYRARLRISYRVSIETRDLEPFHSIEKYRVSNPQYRASTILKIVIFWKLKSPRLPLFRINSSEKCPKKGHQRSPLKKRLSSNISLKK